MGIKEWFCSWLCPDYLVISGDLAMKTQELSDLKLKLSDLESEIVILKQKLLDMGLDWGIEELAKPIDNNYPKAEIFYGGRRMPNHDYNIACDVRLFITPQDYSILKLVKDNNLMITNPLHCNSEILKIYKFCRLGSIYQYDNTLYGSNEVWAFPFEFIYLKENGDCEDNSHYIVSILRAAGLPAFRVRVVVGNCKLGGHSTVYVLGDDLTTWYHINSTGGREFLTKLEDFPTSKMTSMDDLGIKDVWFSFNDKYVWSTFKTESARESFNKEGKDLIINLSLYK